VLVLGTLPGPESLRQRQYYAQSRNVFWRTMGELVGAGPELPYLRRLEVLVERRIALWDVCAAAERSGALDAAIRRASVVPQLPAEFAVIEQQVLPSTSPAHAALSFERKLERWREARDLVSAMLGAP